MQSVVAVVPALNEETTISHVVDMLKKSPLLTEVIVVSDGSTDNTAQLARIAGARVLELPQNRGKGAALFFGVAHTEAPIVLFFDADLLNVSLNHIERLVLPVQSGAAAMTIGLVDRGSIFNWATQRLPKISGMRAIRREIIQDIDPDLLQGFMVETTLNAYCHRHHLSVRTVLLPGLTIKRKIEKVGLKAGLIGYVRMSFEILRAEVITRFKKL